MLALLARSRNAERMIRTRRFATDHLVTAVAIVSTIVVLVPLIAILGYLIYKGASSLNCPWLRPIPAAAQ